MNQNVINIQVIAKDMASSVLKGVGTAAKGLTAPLGLAAGAVKGLFSALTSLPGILAQVGGLLAFKSAVDAASNLEQLTISFTTMLGSAEDAKNLLQDIQEAAIATPFELPELESATKSLIAFGISAEDAVPTLIRLGDVSAGLGINVEEISQIYGKARVQGRLFAEDINQLTGRGIPIIAELAKQFGVAESEVKKLVENGDVGFNNLEKAFKDMTSEGGQFAGLMEAQSKSLAGIQSNISDTLGLMARDFIVNTGIFDGIKQGAENFLNFLNNNRDAIMQFGESVAAGFGLISDALGKVVPYVFDFAKGIALFVVDGDAMNDNLHNIAEALGISDEAFREIAELMEGVRDIVIDLGETWLEHIQGNLEKGKETIDRVLRAFGRLMEPLKNAADRILPPLIEVLKTFWDVMYNDIGPVVMDVLVTAFETAEPVLKAVIDVLGVVLPPILDALSIAFRAVGDIVSFLWNSIFKPIMNLLKGAWELFFGIVQYGWEKVIQPALQQLIDFVEDNIWPIFKPVAEFAEKAFNAAKSAIESAFNWIKKNIINPFLNSIDNAQAEINRLLNRTDEVDAAKQRIYQRNQEAAASNVAGPAFAKGGNFITNGPQWIMVGDNPGGREHVDITPLGHGQGKKGDGINITINNNGGSMNEAQMAARLAFLIKNAQ